MRRRRVDRLTRELLLASHPEERLHLEVWLSEKLIGDAANVVHRLVERRLDRTLGDPRKSSRAGGPFVAMLLVVVAAVGLLASFVWLGESPWRCVDRYTRGFLLLESSRTPQVIRVSPSKSWVRRRDLDRIEVEFRQAPADRVELVVRSGERQRRFAMRPLSATRFIAAPSSREARVTMEVRVGERPAATFHYNVYPESPVRIVRAELFDPGGASIGFVDPERSPFRVAAASRVRFELHVASCPLEAFGLARSITSTELPLKQLGADVFEGSAQLLQDETFRIFWQLPDGVAEPGAGVGFQIEAPPRLDVEVTRPVEGTRIQEGPVAVKARCASELTVDRAFLLCGDYAEGRWAWEAPVNRLEDGRWGVDVELPLEELDGRSGRAVGIYVVLVSSAGVPRTGRSEVVNVLLPDPDTVVTSRGATTLRLRRLRLQRDGEGIGRGDGNGGLGPRALGLSGGSAPGGALGGSGRARSSGPPRLPKGPRRLTKAATKPSTRRRAAEDGEELPVGILRPPEYDRRGLGRTVGRKVRARAVRDLARPSRARDRREPNDPLEIGDRSPRGAGRDLDLATPADVDTTAGTPLPRLSATELEERISRYADFLDKLTPQEKRGVKEFYRRVRDFGTGEK